MTAGAGALAPVVRGGGRPLEGVVAGCTRTDVAAAVAGGLLEQLGAAVVWTPHHVDPARLDVLIETTTGCQSDGTSDGVPVARLVGRVPDRLAGLPPGTIPYACGLATAAAAVLAMISRADVSVDGREVAIQVLLPAVVAAEYQTVHREPAPPRRIGGGWLACDLATADDEAAFARLLDVLGPDARAGQIADEAQLWRLPVCEYVPRAEATDTFGAPTPTPTAAASAVTGSGRPPLAGITVCDLTAMWAGPLATWLLAGAGASVHKVESRVRIDGMRGVDGGGIHPVGADPTTGTASGMFNALNRRKDCHDLDLRDAADRDAFVELVRRSDLVIDSFSRRVMPNFGFSPAELRRERRDLATLSLPAFPEQHPWQLALGPAVHAAAGLGDLGDGRFSAPVVAYPDPLAGFTAFVVAIALVLGAQRGRPPEHAEVTLFGAAEPLARIAPPDTLLRARDPGLGQYLLDDPALTEAAVWDLVTDGAGTHRYPRHPFRGGWTPTASTPAPAIGSATVR